MSRSRIDRHRARHLKGLAQDRARQYFARFTFVRDRLQGPVGWLKPLIDESALELRYGCAGSVSKRCVCQIDFWVKSTEGLEALCYRLRYFAHDL